MIEGMLIGTIFGISFSAIVCLISNKVRTHIFDDEIPTERQLEKLIDTVEDGTRSVYRFFPGRYDTMSNEQYFAASKLFRRGYVVLRHQGDLDGYLAKARPSSQETADQRRAAFRIVE